MRGMLLVLAPVALVSAAAPRATPPRLGGMETVTIPRAQAVDDTLATARLLAAVRGASPLFCELAVRSVDGRTWWGNSGSGSGGPLEMDSVSSELIRWLHREHQDARMVPRLASAIRDADGCVRRVAGSLLGHVRHPSATAALVAALDDQSAETRAVAALGLGMAETAAALQPLVRRLGDPSPGVRRSAAWALGELEDKAAMLPLIQLLERDADARVRQAAAVAIGKVTG